MICGAQVGLVPITARDLPLVQKWGQDQDTLSMFWSPFLMSSDALLKWYKALLEDPTRLRFIVERLDDRARIGLIGLEHIQYRSQEAELAALIIDSAERRQGWADKAVNVLIRYAFEDLNLNRLYARILASNRIALRVAEKAGLKNEGALREAIYHNWAYEDLIYMSILREEWKRGEPPSRAAK